MKSSIVVEGFNTSSSNCPSSEIISIADSSTSFKIPWYKRIFHHPNNSEESEEEEEISSTVLEVKNIHKTYLLGLEGVPAIRGVDLIIHRGEFVIIVGKSGSGKSSLLNILGTVDIPTRGEMIISGCTLTEHVKDSLISSIRLHSIGFIFQTFNLIPSMTASQNIELPLLLRVRWIIHIPQLKGGLTKAQRKIAVDELLHRVGMDNRGDHYPSQLSGGEQQRISIARGLANSPEILLLDEPTGDLDTLNTIRIINLLVELHNMGITLVMVTHDASLPSIATRVIVMNDGKVMEEIVNSDDTRFEALEKLNAGIEDLSVFENGHESIESNRNCIKTEIRRPCDYEDVHVIVSSQNQYNNILQCMTNRETESFCIVCFIMKVDTILIFLSILWIVISLCTVLKMNKEVSEPYMDEIFHYPMTERYFEGDYSYWDPKITTFPGLYHVGNIFCKCKEFVLSMYQEEPTNVCTLSSLRWMNYILLLTTSIAVYYLVKLLNPTNKREKSFLWMLQIMLLPTIICPYFLYYTDGLSLLFSVTSIVCALRSDRGYQCSYVYLSALFTLLAIFVRQTNIILTVLNPAIILLLRYGLLHKNDKFPSLTSELFHFFSLFFSEFRFVIQIAFPFLILFGLFITFFIWNDFSVVVGDRDHHTISLHLMQVCYFAVFFCVSFVDEILWKFYSLCKNYKDNSKYFKNLFIRGVFCCLFAAYCISNHFIVHPFILSDNRHFVFYLFKDIIIPYKYLLIPIYGISLSLMLDILLSRLSTFSCFVFCLLFGVILISSPVVEFRYYSLPILVLICVAQPKTHPIISLSLSIGADLITFYLFFFRSFIWNDGSVAHFMW